MTNSLFGLVNFFVAGLPGRVGVVVRRITLGPFFRKVGRRLNIGVGVRIHSPGDITLGDDVWIDDYCILIAGKARLEDRFTTRRELEFTLPEGRIEIGSRVHVASFCQLQGHAGITVGDDSTIGSHSLVYTVSNHYRSNGQSSDTGLVCKYSSNAPLGEQSLIVGPVRIGDATAVTPHCVLLSGADLGEGSWLLSHSSLRDRIPPFRFAEGSPAIDIGERPIG